VAFELLSSQLHSKIAFASFIDCRCTYHDLKVEQNRERYRLDHFSLKIVSASNQRQLQFQLQFGSTIIRVSRGRVTMFADDCPPSPNPIVQDVFFFWVEIVVLAYLLPCLLRTCTWKYTVLT
jgi:hypothetical protein